MPFIIVGDPLDKSPVVWLRWSSVSIIDRSDTSIIDNSAHYGYLNEIIEIFLNRITLEEYTIVITGERMMLRICVLSNVSFSRCIISQQSCHVSML